MSEVLTKDQKFKLFESGALKTIQKKFGENSVYYKDKEMPEVPILCSTGSISLDDALTIGGFPMGRIIEIGGQESSGKSTLCLISIATCQKQGLLCAYLDVEQTFDPEYSRKLNVIPEELAVIQPDNMEDTFEILHELIKSKVMSLIIVDSINSMVTKSALQGEVGDSEMGKRARILSTELPKIVSECADNNCTVIFLSQIRSKIGVTYGSPEVIGLGNSMKFMASVRIKTSKSDMAKAEDESQESIDINMSVFKNKVGVPYKKAKFTLLTGKDGEYGIDSMKEIIDYAIEYDIVKKAGSWYSYGEEKLGQGMPNVKKFFKENNDIFEKVKQQILDKLQEKRDQQKIKKDSFSSVMQEKAEEIKPKRRDKKSDENIPENVDKETGEIKDAEIVE